MKRALAIVSVGLTLATACSSEPRATDPSATPNPEASATVPGATVLGATYGSPLIAEVATVRACTLVSIGEIGAATGLGVGSPAALGPGPVGCTWSLDGEGSALTLTVTDAAGHAPSATASPEPDLGDAAAWVEAGDGRGTLHVLVEARDRAFTLSFAPGLVIETRPAARAIALAIVPRL